jgi:separase
LDKNVQGFPWESIPILRGRAVSRIPSLPFLLDQVDMVRRLSAISAPRPAPRPDYAEPLADANSLSNGHRGSLLDPAFTPTTTQTSVGDVRLSVDSRKVFYILNPSGDLTRTQTHFEPWIAQMVAKAGWKGIVGRPPTELEMVSALSEYDLVLYFGHGGGEQYVRSHKVRHLSKCATTMLWGCSSGYLKDQGDLDRAGTAWNYMVAGW